MSDESDMSEGWQDIDYDDYDAAYERWFDRWLEMADEWYYSGFTNGALVEW